jgi:hypothetical protein
LYRQREYLQRHDKFGLLDKGGTLVEIIQTAQELISDHFSNELKID